MSVVHITLSGRKIQTRPFFSIRRTNNSTNKILDCDSEGLGVIHGTDQLTKYAKQCPDAQLVVSGYSQVSQFLLVLLAFLDSCHNKISYEKISD